MKRADKIYTSVTIMEDIWKSIYEAELMITDLTHRI